MPASVASSRAEPIWAATAPAASAAAMSSPSAMPPAAIRGSAVAAATSPSSASRGNGSRSWFSNEPWWPPASAPWTTSASTLREVACSASASRGHRAPDAAAAALEPLDDLALGTAEREGDDFRSLACCDVELGRPVVVRPTQLAGGHAVSLRFALHPVDVRLERRLVDDVASRTEDVQADRPRGQRAEFLKLSLCGCRRLVARGEETDPPCLGHGRGQSRRRRASCERCAHDRRRQPRRARSRQRFFLRPLLRCTGCTGLPLRRAARFGASGICICWPAASM